MRCVTRSQGCVMPNLRKRTKVSCSNCGKVFSMNSGELVGRRKKSKSGLIFHSMECYVNWRRSISDNI